MLTTSKLSKAMNWTKEEAKDVHEQINRSFKTVDKVSEHLIEKYKGVSISSCESLISLLQELQECIYDEYWYTTIPEMVQAESGMFTEIYYCEEDNKYVEAVGTRN